MRAVLRLLGDVARPDDVRIPQPRPAETGPDALHRERGVAGVDVLLEDARPALERTPGEEAARPDVEAERVVGVVGVDHEVIHQAAGFRQGPRPDRLRRRLVDGLAPVEEGAQLQPCSVVRLVFHASEQARAFRRGEHEVVGRVVEPVGVAPRVVVVTRAAGVGRIVDRHARDAVVQGAVHEAARVRVAEDDPALRRERAAVEHAGARLRPARLLVIGGPDARLVGVGDVRRGARGAPRAAEGQLEVRGLAAVLEGAAVRARRDAAGLAGDHVHDARDRIGTVDRRGAVAQHFHAFDHARRNAVQVRRARHAAAGRAVHPAQAVDQDEHAFRAEMAQVHLGCSRGDAAAVRGKAEVAAAVEARRERRARDREPGEQVAERAEPRPVPVVPVHVEHPVPRGERIAPDARPGHDDFLDERVRTVRSRLRRGWSRGQRGCEHERGDERVHAAHPPTGSVLQCEPSHDDLAGRHDSLPARARRDKAHRLHVGCFLFPKHPGEEEPWRSIRYNWRRT